jgi:Uma2 family endonuclease
MTLPRPHFTYQEYLQLPDDQRYEVLEGELVVSPSPNADHQRILFALAGLFFVFRREQAIGEFFVAPLDVILSEHNVVQPDLLFISQDRLSIVQQQGVHGAPDLVIEILSPSDPERDLETKRRTYGQYGVREYWIVDPASRSVEILTQQGSGLDTWQRFQGDTSLRSPLLTGLVLNLAEIFPS